MHDIGGHSKVPQKVPNFSRHGLKIPKSPTNWGSFRRFPKYLDRRDEGNNTNFGGDGFSFSIGLLCPMGTKTN